MSAPVKIPADVDIEDRVLGPLTARQLALFTATGLALYLAWRATQNVLPVPVFVVVALVLAGAVAVLVLSTRDGLSLDRLLAAAVRQRLGPRLRLAAPQGIAPVPEWLSAHATSTAPQPGTAAAGIGLPAEDVSEAGVIDLGRDGLAVVAACSTVNFALRTPGEQDALVGVFARWAHSLTAPAQILVRAERLDVSGQVAELEARAPSLPHPALEAAATAHADYLADLAASSDLLRRQVLLVLREPRAALPARRGLAGLLPSRGAPVPPHDEPERRAAETRLARRLSEAAELLHPAGITVTGLDATQASTVLAAACNPDRLAPAHTAADDDVITTADAEEPR
ncbi:PrgI family protein [Saccharopolyspora sp. HNM0986]|uniref:PrgI family protein n=1 Tax=Saccharopolyspora galaxeae TaxID=2781241 RepID=UPI001909D985|nr:PrgI family protein [Saccharopolyspora sp. HNM0986]MBK0870228.1 PrgI family protein [Saccharopolyspora sp. HNM0986]